MGFSPGEFTDRRARAKYHWELKDGKRIVLWNEGEAECILDLEWEGAVHAYMQLRLLIQLCDNEAI